MRAKKAQIEVILLKRPKRVSTLVGLTGSFGTGKSTVARYFRQLGAHVIDADQLAHKALKPGTPTYDSIRDHFGKKNVVGKKGVIDRRKLAEIVFHHPGKRKTLEAIVHPFVFKEIEKIANKKKGVLILEIPLLFETHFNEKMDVNIVVKAGIKQQVKRLARRSGVEERQVRARIKAQMPLSKKERLADFVVDNSGSLKSTKKRVLNIWNQLKSMIRGE